MDDGTWAKDMGEVERDLFDIYGAASSGSVAPDCSVINGDKTVRGWYTSDHVSRLFADTLTASNAPIRHMDDVTVTHSLPATSNPTGCSCCCLSPHCRFVRHGHGRVGSQPKIYNISITFPNINFL